MRILASSSAWVFAFVSVAAVACGGNEASAPPPQAPAPNTAPPDMGSKPAAVAPASGPALRLADNDEGMWTFDRFPAERVKKLHGWGPSKEWLDQVSQRAVKLAFGCSGSIVSPNGLVMTNHHCVSECVSQLSKKGRDYIAQGYYAKSEAEELKCPDFEIDQLSGVTDVTSRVEEATKGAPESEFHAKQRAVKAVIEKECATSDAVRCDVVTLYNGGQYHLYKYHRFQDVRLVFAPEFAAAFFGGDPDNFNFPRYDFDISYVRLYEGNKPAKTEQHFRYSAAGPKEGEPIFVAGHPYKTERLLTVAQLEYVRDVEIPEKLMRLSELRGALIEFGKRNAESKRIASTELFDIENAIKAYTGRYQSLVDKEFFARKVNEEKRLRAYAAAHPDLEKTVGDAWNAIARAQEQYRDIHLAHGILENAHVSSLFKLARALVRAGDEIPKPNDQRLSEFNDAKLPALKEELFSPAPIYDDLEALELESYLTWMRAALGTDEPAVQRALAKETPAGLAAALVRGTKLKDIKVRKALFEGGKAAIEKSTDPLIQLLRRIDGDARAVRKTYEDTIFGVVRKNGELVAKAHFAAYGQTTYPDATATLRLSFGELKGWEERGKPVPPMTMIGGAFERHTGKEPYALPKRWLDAKSKLTATTPFNFVSTNDIIGGNSGSPMVNKEGEIVGLIFDGNIHSLGGAFGYNAANNRCVSLHSAAILEALDKVYGASRILAEIK
ncbi:S46 family peptidase [Pendulispora albinea]|uniref:Dipeptidyl-peptidase n=1 Tax=Pendulispora albinea TaxID=2741071 RepID=A0ABZ2LJW5_9BACT